jgi:hypothetical protein
VDAIEEEVNSGLRALGFELRASGFGLSLRFSPFGDEVGEVDTVPAFFCTPSVIAV